MQHDWDFFFALWKKTQGPILPVPTARWVVSLDVIVTGSLHIVPLGRCNSRPTNKTDTLFFHSSKDGSPYWTFQTKFVKLFNVILNIVIALTLTSMQVLLIQKNNTIKYTFSILFHSKTILVLFLKHGLWATHMVPAIDQVPTGTVFATGCLISRWIMTNATFALVVQSPLWPSPQNNKEPVDSYEGVMQLWDLLRGQEHSGVS